MRKPKRRGVAISDLRVEEWRERFGGFRDTPTKEAIERWIRRFQGEETDIAARILDAVEVISSSDIRTAFRRLLAELPGWSKIARDRVGNWVFVARESSAGQSGGSMLHLFRQANGLAAERYNSLFKYNRDLPGLGLGPQDNVVFVDDFSGTGEQVLDHWPSIRELIGDRPNLFLILIAATELTISRIENETHYNVLCDISLGDIDNIFSNKCKHFKKNEKEKIKYYCTIANHHCPRGYGGCGLLVVFHHGCPNNCIPILHANSRNWSGLFPRYDFETRKNT
jgi:hypothetical protein